jgi:hypothetical protein
MTMLFLQEVRSEIHTLDTTVATGDHPRCSLSGDLPVGHCQSPQCSRRLHATRVSSLNSSRSSVERTAFENCPPLLA